MTIMLSERIKEETRQAHQQLEKSVITELKQIRSEKDYADLLKKFHLYFSSLEKAISPFISTSVLADYTERRNSSYLRKDIQELGYEVDAAAQVEVPGINNSLEAMGALYVMEGSIMGGSIIVQILAKYGITRGVSFFSGYGPATAAMWSGFTNALNAQAGSEQEQDVAIRIANETFSRFGDVFEKTEAADIA